LTSAAESSKLLGLDISLSNKRLDLQPTRHRWSGKEIFTWLAGELRIEQESWVLSRGMKEGTSSTFDRRGRQPFRSHSYSRPEEKKVSVVQPTSHTQSSGRPPSSPPPAGKAGYQGRGGYSGKGGKGKGQQQPSTSYRGRDRSSSKGRQPSSHGATPPTQCYNCKNAGRPFEHPWKSCHFAREMYKKRFGHDPKPDGVGGGGG
jgi:hypothetical protein